MYADIVAVVVVYISYPHCGLGLFLLWLSISITKPFYRSTINKMWVCRLVCLFVIVCRLLEYIYILEYMCVVSISVCVSVLVYLCLSVYVILYIYYFTIYYTVITVISTCRWASVWLFGTFHLYVHSIPFCGTPPTPLQFHACTPNPHHVICQTIRLFSIHLCTLYYYSTVLL